MLRSFNFNRSREILIFLKKEEERLKSDCKSAAAIVDRWDFICTERREATSGATTMKYSIGSRRSRRQGRIARNAGRSSGTFRCLSRTFYHLTFPDLFFEPGKRWKTAALQDSTVCLFLVGERTDFLYNLPWNRGLAVVIYKFRWEARETNIVTMDDDFWGIVNFTRRSLGISFGRSLDFSIY